MLFATGTKLEVVGYGRDGPQGALSDEMQSKGYKVSPDSCDGLTVSKGFICVGDGKQNICEGVLF